MMIMRKEFQDHVSPGVEIIHMNKKKTRYTFLSYAHCPSKVEKLNDPRVRDICNMCLGYIVLKGPNGVPWTLGCNTTFNGELAGDWVLGPAKHIDERLFEI